MYFRLHAETVGLAVNYLDRYCSVKPVAVVHYQLVGVTSLLVASKMRDRHPPRILALADLCSGAYERIDIKVRVAAGAGRTRKAGPPNFATCALFSWSGS